MKKSLICIIVIYCFIIACKIIRKEKLPEMEFVFPDSISAIYNGRDTTVFVSKENAKFVVLYDSTFCTPCQTSNLYLWKRFIELNNSNFQTYIIFSPDEIDLHTVRESLLEMNYDFFVYIDSAYSFMKANSNYVWNKINNHFFLLDKRQMIKLLGFPFLEEDKEEEYMKAIEELKQEMRPNG